jgi:triacylglycerol esterase/lipase EstA (alpha/beta hydrolase family)
VLIHGFSYQRGEERLKLLIEEIKKELPEAKIIVPNYLETYSRMKFLLAGKKSVSEYAEIIFEKIKNKIEKPIILVCFSFGGLIGRDLVEKKKVPAKALILVGTPNKGVRFSLKEKLLAIVFIKIFKRPCLEDVRAESKFLQELNESYKRKKPETRYYLIAGKKDKVVPLDSATGIEAQETILIPFVSHSDLIPRKYIGKPTAIWEIIKILKKEASL